MTRFLRLSVRRLISWMSNIDPSGRPVAFASAGLIALGALTPLLIASGPVSPFAGIRAHNSELGTRNSKHSGYGACPLTRSEETQAVEKFKQLLPVVMHGRCLNCHGGVNPYVPVREGKHAGGHIRQTGAAARLKVCQECHSGLPGWDLPIQEMFFTGKSPYDLCVQFKFMVPDSKFFVGHMDNDNGKGPPFTKTAFKGDRALNDMAKDMSAEFYRRPFANLPPPISHDEFVRRVQAWVDVIGEEGWKVKPDCGCIPTGSAWVGTVKTFSEMRTKQTGVLTATATATVRFEIDSSFDVSDDPAEYWKSVSGTLTWETSNTGGECRISGAGSFKIDRGSDDNPLATLRGEHGEKGGMLYSVSLGPWPEPAEPVVNWDCQEADFQSGAMGSYTWWGHELAGMLAPDGKVLKGKFASASGPTTTNWEWDLHLEP